MFAETEAEEPCGKCGGALQVYSVTARRIVRCVRCTTVDLPYDPRALKDLARREKLRQQQLLRHKAAVAMIEAIATAHTRVFPKLPPELVTTDRVLDRWGAAPTGQPAENPDVYHVALPPPLDPRTQERVSDLVKLAGDRAREVTYQLYCRGAPASWIGRQLGMSPRNFGRYWHDVLRDHKARFAASRYPDLISLVCVPP